MGATNTRSTHTSPELITSLNGIKEMVGKIAPSLPLFFDTETTGYQGSDLRTDVPVALQFHQNGTTWIADVRRAGSISRQVIGELLCTLSNEVVLVGHNIKFDLEVLYIHFGLQPMKVWDTMIAEQVIYGLGLSDGRKQGVGFGLKACCERRGISIEKDTRDTFKNMHTTSAWLQPFTQEQLQYMAQDVEVLPRIYQHQKDWFDIPRYNGGTIHNCFDLEMQVTPALAHVEVSGVPIDWDGWMQIIGEEEKKANALREEVQSAFGEAVLDKRLESIDNVVEQMRAWEAARDAKVEDLREAFPTVGAILEPKTGKWGDFKAYWMKKWREQNPRPDRPKEMAIFNLNSPTQLLEAFTELGIPADDTTEDTLKDLADEYPLIGKLLAYRKATKFVQSFGENLKAFVSSADGRLHTDYMQIGASSNRMSCTKPNFQQIPSRGETGQALRKCVKASPGHKILTADFGSQELAIIAELSGDETMLRLFEEEKDLHSETARMMFHLVDQINPKAYMIAPGVSARTAAKTINYGLAYGQTEWGLARGLKIDVKTAKGLIEEWYKPYAQVKKYFDARKAQIFRGEYYARTEHGWVRHFDPLPPEPVQPKKYQDRGNFLAEFSDWKSEHREWEKRRRRLENKLMNTPVQGTGAGITKRALADFFTSVCSYNEKNVEVKIIAVVHDEIVVETPEEYAEEVSQELARCMDAAMRYYLPRVNFPKSDVHIADCWSK